MQKQKCITTSLFSKMVCASGHERGLALMNSEDWIFMWRFYLKPVSLSLFHKKYTPLTRETLGSMNLPTNLNDLESFGFTATVS